MTGLTRRGPTDAPTIVFLHGGVINRHMWQSVIDNLADDYQCVAIDLPGHGDLSDESFTMVRAVEVTMQAIESVGVDSAFLAGLSLGGYVAQAHAAAQPKSVLGLVLSGSTIRYTGWDGLSTKLYGYLFPILSRPARKAFAAKVRADLGEDFAGAIIEGGLSTKGGGQSLRRLPGRDYAADMTGYEGPIVLANGERDTPNRESESLFLEHHPHAESVVIEDAGHACALQQPGAFANAVRHMVHLAHRPA